jgi:hypothetical protein
MEFKRLLGNRIYVEMPKPEEKSKLIVDENTKEARDREMLKKMAKLVVYAIGETVTNISVGDVILIDPSAIARAPIIPLSEENSVLLISPFDVIHIW